MSAAAGAGDATAAPGADPAAVCEQVLDVVARRARPRREAVEAEVTTSRVRTGLTRFANSAIHQHVGEETVSVTVKVADGGRVATADTTRSDPGGLDDVVERAFAAASVRPVDPDWPGLSPPAPAVADSRHDPATFAAEPQARAEQVRKFIAAGQGLSAAGFVDTEGRDTAFANSAGQRVAARATRATLDGIHQTATSAGAAHHTSRRLADVDGAVAGEVAARLARDGEGAVDLDPGRYEVVLGPECVATIAVFLAYYGFNAKQHIEGSSFARLGADQFDPAVTIWDDATDDRSVGLPFDAEGTPKRRLVLVDAGTTANLTHDRRTALQAGTETTGHAIAGGAAWGAVATDLFVGRGGAGDDDLVAGVDHGILVTRFHYCRILDPKTQVVTGLTRNGTFLIEDGEVTRPLANLRFTQSFVAALSPGHVLGVGASVRFADSEFGPGIVVAPAIRLAEWKFSGGAHG